jgi:hypothetical protein
MNGEGGHKCVCGSEIDDVVYSPKHGGCLMGMRRGQSCCSHGEGDTEPGDEVRAKAFSRQAYLIMVEMTERAYGRSA